MYIFRLVSSSILTALLTLFTTSTAMAQGDAGDGNLYAVAVLIIIGALILVSAVLMLSENFISIESKKAGVATNSGIQLFTDPAPEEVGDAPFYDLKKGHDILLKGEATDIIDANVKRYAISPMDFRGMAPIPKVTVAVGDEVKAGDVIFHDKKDPTVKYVAPVSGEVVEVRRGDKRAIAEVIILADKEIQYKQLDPPSVVESSREDLVNFLTESGGWTLFNQRPYDMLPSIDEVPANIFISTFDTAPLAPDLNMVVKGKAEAFQKGLDTLRRLTSGAVHLGMDGRKGHTPSSVFLNATGVEKNWFRGQHPVGNVGIQIHHIAPINAGQKVWTLNVQEVIALGTLMFKGIWDASRVIAVTGGQIANPGYVRTYQGAQLGELLENNMKEGKSRLIDGDVLSGKQKYNDDFLSYRADQVSAIEEGDYYEMFGWLLPIKPRPTVSKTFPNFLYPDLKFDGDTNAHGEHRAFVVTGEYEKVLPMKVFPQHLMKAIMVGDLEQMEGLGIYELSEEDIALCEFACTSKQPLQSILRDGLDMLMEQG